MPMVLTLEIARAAAQDAGNRAMQAAGRTVWDRTDYDASVAEFYRLWTWERECEARNWPISTPEPAMWGG